MPANQFTTQNIVTLLSCARGCKDIEAVLARAKSPVKVSMLKRWLRDGRKDILEERNTAYALFTAEWDKRFTGEEKVSSESVRMLAMKSALKTLADRRDPILCECGQAKARNSPACKECMGG